MLIIIKPFSNIIVVVGCVLVFLNLFICLFIFINAIFLICRFHIIVVATIDTFEPYQFIFHFLCFQCVILITMVVCVKRPAPADTVMNHVVHHRVTKSLDSVMMGVLQDGWDPPVHRVRSVLSIP